MDEENQVLPEDNVPSTPEVMAEDTYSVSVQGGKLSEKLNDTQFQTDLVSFFQSRRYGYSGDKIRQLGKQGLFKEYQRHMRYQDTNEYTAASDLFFVKDTVETTDKQRASFGRLMQAWDNSEGEDWDTAKIWDYASAVVSAPSTWASIASAGIAAPGIKASTLAASAASRIMARKVAMEVLAKETAKKAFVKGAAISGTMEAALSGGTDFINQKSREGSVDGYEFDAVRFGTAVATAGILGGGLGGVSRIFMSKNAGKTIDAIAAGETVRAERRAAAEEAASKTLRSASSKALIDDVASKVEYLANVPDSVARKNPYKFKLNPLPAESVERGNYIKKVITGDETAEGLVVAGMTPSVIKRITAAYTDLVVNTGYTGVLGDEGKRITQIIADAMAQGKKYMVDSVDQAGNNVQVEKSMPDVVADILNKYDLTREQFSDFLIADVSESAKILQQFGQVKKAMSGVAPVKIPSAEELAQVEAAKGTLNSIMENLKLLSQRTIVTKNVEQLDKAAKEIKKGSSAMESLRALDGMRIGFMTSQLGTTVANVKTGVGRMGVDVLDRFFENTFNLRNPFSGTMTMAKALSPLGNAQKDLLMTMAARDIPDKMEYMLNDVLRVEGEVGGSTLMAQTARFVNVFNSATDNIFKNAAFYTSIERQIMDAKNPALGKDFMEFVSIHHTLEALPEDMIRKAVKDALRFTFQSSYTGEKTLFAQGARGVMNAHKKIPFIVSSQIPFPRFIANQMEFIHDYTPFLALPTAAYRAVTGEVAGKTTQMRLARATTGSTLLLMAYAWRLEQGLNTAPTETKSEKYGDVKDVSRIAGPMNAFLVVADAVVRHRAKERGEKVTDPFFDADSITQLGLDVTEAAVGTTNLPNGQNITELAKAIVSGNLNDKIRKDIADVAATFTYPLVSGRDLIGQAFPEEAIKQYTRSLQGKGLDPDAAKDEPVFSLFDVLEVRGSDVLRAGRFLPDFDILTDGKKLSGNVLRTPFNNNPVVDIDSGLKQVTATSRRASRSPLQDEMIRLGLKEYKVYSSTREKNPVLDYAVIELLSRKEAEGGIDLPKMFLQFKEANLNNYNELPAESQAFELNKFLMSAIKVADERVTEGFNNLAIREPKKAANYIRNAYTLAAATIPEDVLNKTAQRISRGQVKTAEEWIALGNSITDDANIKLLLLEGISQLEVR